MNTIQPNQNQPTPQDPSPPQGPPPQSDPPQEPPQQPPLLIQPSSQPPPSQPSQPILPQNQPTPEPPHQKDPAWKIVLTIIFIFIFPPVGLILLWTLVSINKSVKAIISILYTVFYLIPIGAMIIIFLLLAAYAPKTDIYKDKFSIQADMVTVETQLEYYYTKKSLYPITNSFKNMFIQLQKLDEKLTEPKPPTDDYKYQYCSTKGDEYRLRVEEKNKLDALFTLGDDTCRAGE